MHQGNYAQAVPLLEASKIYPEQLGTGQPADPDYRVQDYLLLLCFDKSGSAANAKQAAERKAAIDAYAARSSQQNYAQLSPKLDAWHAGGFQQADPSTALKQLIAIIHGGKGGAE